MSRAAFFLRHLALPLAAGALLAACASNGPAPSYDPASGAGAQADSFIKTLRPGMTKNVRRVAVTSCNVLFAQTSSASAQTSAGIFNHQQRAEASVTQVYTLNGLAPADMQRMADGVCAGAERQLAAAGYEVVSHARLKQSAAFQKLAASGKASPLEFSQGASKYLAFTRGGESLSDDRYLNVAEGLGVAFRQASGESPMIYRGLVMEELGASAVNVTVLIDFAQVQSNQRKGFGSTIGGQNTAQVAGDVALSASGDISFLPHDELKCWDRLGKHECMAGSYARFSSAQPVLVRAPFYERIENTTTTGDTAIAVVTKGLALLGGGTSTSVTRYRVDVKPAAFEATAMEAAKGFVEMASVKASAERR